MRRYGDDDLVLVVLGDHQPATIITGQGASHDVPISVIAHDPTVLDRIAGWGWQDGMRPSPQAPVWPMNAFRDRFLTAFSRPEPGRERVAQQHHVADLAHLGERRAPPRVPREAPVAHEARRARVADEERRHDELQLVDEVVGQELGVHDAAALDHEPLHAAVGEVLAEPAHPHARPPSTIVATGPSRARASATRGLEV